MGGTCIVADNDLCACKQCNELGNIGFAGEIDYRRLRKRFKTFGNGLFRFCAYGNDGTSVFGVNFFSQSGEILYRPFFDSTVAPGTNTA